MWLAPTGCLCSDLDLILEIYQWWVTLLKILKGDRREFFLKTTQNYLIKNAN